MELGPGYKHTEVGVIPKDWEVKTLREIAKIATGNTPPTQQAANYGDEFLFVSPVDLGEAKYITHTEKRLSKTGFAISRRFPKDTILFVCIGSTIGKTGIAPIELTSNQQINAIFPSSAFWTEYLYYAVSSLATKIRALAGEQAVPIVNKTQFSKTSVALPPLPEQRAIAGALSDVDALISGLDRLIAKKRDLKQAAMQQLLTGKLRLPGCCQKPGYKQTEVGEIPEDWKVEALGDIFNISGGFSASRAQLTSLGHCYLHYGDIHTSAKSFIDVRAEYLDIPKLNIPLKRVSSKSLLSDGDIVFVDASEDNEGTSKHVVVINPEGVPYISGLHTIVAKGKTDSLDNGYKRYCFQTSDVKRQFYFYAVGTKVSGISKTNIKKIFIPLPPIPEQTAIATVLADMDAELDVLEQRRDKTHDLKQGMMQELLTGRIRLV